MTNNHLSLIAAGLLMSCLPAAASVKPHSVVTHRASARMHKSLRTPTRHESGGMDSERATQIQTALIQHGYLSGVPSGTWDAQTSAAMAKLQADNGWQSKITPDARGLMKLGLGPQQDPTTKP